MAPTGYWAGELDTAHLPRMSHQLAQLLSRAPVAVAAGGGVFELSASYPEILRHAAARPEDRP